MVNEEREKQTAKGRLSSFARNVKRLLTRRNQCVLLLLTLVLVAAAVFDAVYDFLPEPADIALYVLATAGFVATCALLVRTILRFAASVVLPFVRSNPIVNILIADNRLRASLTAVPGMGISLIYAAFNGVVGVTASSAWYGSLSAYYLLLCIMRLLSVSYAKQIYSKKGQEENLEQRELKVYRRCGAMLAFLSIPLGGAVIMLVLGDGGVSYPGLMIYAVATYTFYRLTMSIINMVKARKEKSLLLKTLRNISYSDALVSLLSLQSALLAAFGQGAREFAATMNALTGAGVCLMIVVLGVCMVHDAKRRRSVAQTGNEAKE